MVVQGAPDQRGGVVVPSEMNEGPYCVEVPERRIVFGWNLLEDAVSLLISPLKQLDLSETLLRHPVAGIDRQRLAQLFDGLVEQPDVHVDEREMMVCRVQVGAEVDRAPVLLDRALVGELLGRAP